MPRESNHKIDCSSIGNINDPKLHSKECLGLLEVKNLTWTYCDSVGKNIYLFANNALPTKTVLLKIRKRYGWDYNVRTCDSCESLVTSSWNLI